MFDMKLNLDLFIGNPDGWFWQRWWKRHKEKHNKHKETTDGGDGTVQPDEVV